MLQHLNARIKTLTFIDIGLIKWSVVFATIILVKLFPQILNISYAVLAVLMVACMARPVYKVWIKE